MWTNYSKHRLLQNEDLALHCWNGDGRRFVEHFRRTWNQMPSDVCRLILDLCQKPYATIELLNEWSPDEAYGQVECDYYGSKLSSITIRFRAISFTHLPDEAAQWVIAHELAHVFEKTGGQFPSAGTANNTESRVNMIAKEWGFDPGRLHMVMMLQNSRALSIGEACAELERIGNLQ